MRKDWVEVALGEILKVSSGKGLSKNKMSGSGFPVYGGNGITGYHNESLFHEQKLIIGRVGVKCGVTHLTKDQCWITDNALIVRFFSSEMSLKFMQLRLQFANLNKLSNSTAQPVISGSKIYPYRLFLPPLPEQRSIVRKIEGLFTHLDQGIADLNKAKDQLKIYRQAVLKKAFEGELTKEWREKQTDLPTADELLEQINTERERYYENQLSEWKQAVQQWEANGKEGKKPGKPRKTFSFKKIQPNESFSSPIYPNSWITILIKSLTNSIVPNRDKPKSFSGDYGWVLTPYISEKSIKLDHSKIKEGLSADEIIMYKAKVIPIDSVVMTCVGTLGLSFVVEKEIVINQQLHAFLPSQLYLSKYLAYYIRNSINYLNKISTSTTVKYLNKSNCEGIPMPYCSITEQNQIVKEIESRLSVCDQVEKSIDEGLAKASALRQSILKKAFEGTLLTNEELEACRNEPDWEPASVLLEKIRKEKELTKTKKTNYAL